MMAQRTSVQVGDLGEIPGTTVCDPSVEEKKEVLEI